MRMGDGLIVMSNVLLKGKKVTLHWSLRSINIDQIFNEFSI